MSTPEKSVYIYIYIIFFCDNLSILMMNSFCIIQKKNKYGTCQKTENI